MTALAREAERGFGISILWQRIFAGSFYRFSRLGPATLTFHLHLDKIHSVKLPRASSQPGSTLAGVVVLQRATKEAEQTEIVELP